MEVIESWEDHNANNYAIVRYSKNEQRKYSQKGYEAMWIDDITNNKPGLNSFGGTVGYRIADFNTLEEAQDYLLKGVAAYDVDADIWVKMIEV